jgi:hypothetical protein
LGLYIIEGLRWWGAVTNRWRKRVTFNTTLNQHWYDLQSVVPALTPTVTDRNLLVEIQYHLLEPTSPTSWIGSEQFTFAGVVAALQDAHDNLLGGHPLQLTRTIHNVPLIPRFSFDAISPTRAILYIRRAEWINALTSVIDQLWSVDEDQQRFHQPDWNLTSDTPVAYSVAVTPQLELQFIPAPNAPGQLALIYQLAAPVLNPVAGVVLSVPDVLAWAVKWDALGKLLMKEGAATDSARAQYCGQRADEGRMLADILPSALELEIDGRLANIAAVHDLDAYRSNWANEVAGTPDQVAFAGYNLMALAPKPDAGPHSITFDAVIPPPIPAVDADNIQLGKDELDAVLDYAQHIAAFKQGGEEFLDTMPKYQQAAAFAAELNGRLKAAITAKKAMDRRSRDEEARRPVKVGEESRVPRPVPEEQ